MILVTGSEGLVGRYLVASLAERGHEVRPFDIRRRPRQDICSAEAVADALAGVTGVVHLAAVSPVIWAEQDPTSCHAVNVDALNQILRYCFEQSSRPWILFASSREVYGRQEKLPVSEQATLLPINNYARSKVAGEKLISEAAAAGLVANIFRLSNVYGDANDYSDRVVMAFAIAAAHGGTMRVEGSSNLFDFTAVNEVAHGIALLVEATISQGLMPALHFVSGVGTTLGELAAIASELSEGPVTVAERPPRDFDVDKFVGDPFRASQVLGWASGTPLRMGVARLIASIRASGASGNRD